MSRRELMGVLAVGTPLVLSGCGSSGPGDDQNGPAAERSLEAASVRPGGSIAVTLSVEFPTDASTVSIGDAYSGPVRSGSIDSVTVDGRDVTGTATTADANAGEVTVALESVGGGEPVTVTYSVTTEDSAEVGETVEFTGLSDPDVVAGEREADFGSDTLTIAAADGDGDGEADEPSSQVAPTDIEDAGRYYVGQTLRREEDISTDETVDVVHADGSSSLAFADENGVVIIDTSGMAEGQYTLQGADGADIVQFRLIEHELDIDFDSGSVANTGDETSANLQITTNRRPNVNWFTASLAGEQVAPGDLQRVVGTGSLEDLDGDGTAEVLRVEQSEPNPLSLDFGGLQTGDFTLTTDPPDTDASASATITVEEVTPGSAQLSVESKVIQEEAGDVATIPIDLSDTTSAELVLGSEDLSYRVSLEGHDDDGDGAVTVRWNTHHAGQSGDPSSAFEAVGADAVSGPERSTSVFDRPIAYEAYPLSLRVGDDETDVGTVSVQDPDVVERRLTVLTAPGDVESVEAARDAASESDNLDDGDWLLLHVETAGIYGYVTDGGSLFDNDQGVSLTLHRTSTGTHHDPERLDLQVPAATVEMDPAANGFWLAMPTDEVDAPTHYEEYRATFEIDAAVNPYVEETVELSAAFSIDRT